MSFRIYCKIATFFIIVDELKLKKSTKGTLFHHRGHPNIENLGNFAKINLT